ncbi:MULTISPECIES: DMT family transporter [Streptococcus]|uniref:QacE family quaternary ammonium compound efflux SMR transporter n=2 Tax=Streptococcus TaxID=1301 RepID=A0A081JG24_STRMC|nr:MULTISPECIES: SMR family transporter [Streptococcus]CCF02881.1 Small multidrug resistance protein [Streptococcus macedonicus ACA-DC 198]ALT80471.1 multidrug transporter [Streptococcus gallolyticus]KEH51787.1 multidrug transporter [Streptococcus macedonicus]MBF6975997.1 EamA family transporter [Streptococcus macedonicus]MBT1047605.1 EamA family transporter [Streptococcus macedonicus]
MSYLHLFIAILGELLGTNLLKLLDDFTKPTPTVSALLSYGVCFYFLSLAMRKIPLGVTYTTWSAVGLVLIAFISVMIFKETLNVYSVIGLILIIIGVVMVNLLGNAGH